MKGVFEAAYFKDSTHSQAFHLLSVLPLPPQRKIYKQIFSLNVKNSSERRDAEEVLGEISQLSCLFRIQLIFTALSLRIYKRREGNI